MKKSAIRKPTGPAVIFLLSALGFFSTIISSTIFAQIFENIQELTPLALFRLILWGTTNLIISVILFSKKYNNTLIVGTSLLIIPSLVTLFLNITPYSIAEIIFYLVLIAFTYIMVNMPETPIREKASKFRFIIPVFQFALILISTIQTVQEVYEKFVEISGTYPNEAANIAITLLPTLLGSIVGFLPVLCYVWLANWLADPREK